eukprot:m.137851 g.137851  ORF g.137851 m.137851 type:complete len:879 (+) comp15904_c0_seq1:136-2772(+)
MAQWRHVQRLPEVRGLYASGPLPLEVRHYFADWIEAQPWSQVATGNDAQQAASLLQHLITLVQEKLQQLHEDPQDDTFILSTQLTNAIGGLQQLLNENPLHLPQFLNHALSQEQDIASKTLSQARNTASSPASSPKTQQLQPAQQSFISPDFSLILRDVLQKAEGCRKEIEPEVSTLEQRQETFLIQYHGFLQIEKDLAEAQRNALSRNDPQVLHYLQAMAQQKQQAQTQLTTEAQSLLEGRQQLYHKLLQGAESIVIGHQLLLENLDRWRSAQRLNSISKDELDRSLDHIQTWADAIMQQLWQIRQVAKQLWVMQLRLPVNPHVEEKFEVILVRVNDMISALVHRSLIIDQQPPQVLKTQTRFQSSVRFLIGRSLNLHLDPPEVSVHIVSESQVRAIVETTAAQQAGNIFTKANVPAALSSGDILNNKKGLIFQAGNNVLVAPFKTLSLRRIKRGDRSDQMDHTVTEEKFALCFRFSLTLPGGDVTFIVQELSLPLVVVVHGNQVPSAEATVLWDNAFAIPGRTGFEVEQSVSWRRLDPHLRRFWASSDLQPLQDSHMTMLANLLGLSNLDEEVSWSRFSKDFLPGCMFTFWEWFHGCCETTRKHLRPLWNEGLIHGFIDKDNTYHALAGCPPRTFLVRFSTSLVGAVSVSWVDFTGDEMQVYHLQPWLNKDIQIRSLADRVSDLDQLQILHPDKPKHATFGKFYSSQAKQTGQMLTKGYIPADLKAFISPQHVGNEPTYQPRADMETYVKGPSPPSFTDFSWYTAHKSQPSPDASAPLSLPNLSEMQLSGTGQSPEYATMGSLPPVATSLNIGGPPSVLPGSSSVFTQFSSASVPQPMTTTTVSSSSPQTVHAHAPSPLVSMPSEHVPKRHHTSSI